MSGSADAARARFAAATAAHLEQPLADGISIRHVTQEEVIAAGDSLWKQDPRSTLGLDALYSAEQKQQIADLEAVHAAPLAHRMVFERDGALVGAYWAVQQTSARYYMINTIFAPSAQGKGLYRALLPRVIAAAAAAGFAEIYSRHRGDNNAILVPKLKAGFLIAAFEVTPKFGLLIHLRRYLVDGLDHAFRHRIDGSYAAELCALGVLRED